MNREQMQKIKNKLRNRRCPACGNSSILPCYNMINSEITDIEEMCWNNIDTSKEHTYIECNYCGYIMRFNTDTLFR